MLGIFPSNGSNTNHNCRWLGVSLTLFWPLPSGFPRWCGVLPFFPLEGTFVILGLCSLVPAVFSGMFPSFRFHSWVT